MSDQLRDYTQTPRSLINTVGTGAQNVSGNPAKVIRFRLHQRSGAFVGWVRIDAQDRDRVLSRRWSLASHDGRPFAVTLRGKTAGGYERQVLLHRFILGLAKDDRRKVVFLNGDSLDCRRSNMQLVECGADAREYWEAVRTGTAVD